VRSKARRPVESGAKISVSLVDGMSFVDRISWDADNESGDLVEQIQAYHGRVGHYLAAVHADHIYRIRPVSTATVKRFASQGRPRKVSEATAEQVKHAQQQGCDDATARMAIEGKFGQGKRRLG